MSRNSTIKSTILEYLSDFVALIYPKICAACGKSLYNAEECICTLCRYNLPKTDFHTYNDNPVSRTFCGRANITAATAFYYFYKGLSVQKLVHALKYRGRTEVGSMVGQWLGMTISESSYFAGVEVIVPVPLHERRLRTRGYNQSYFIAQGISKAIGLPVADKALMRNTYTGTQTRLGKFSRWENVEKMFQLMDTEKVAGKHVLLVDDVITTGATLEACANVLLQAPQTKVSVAAMAYAV